MIPATGDIERPIPAINCIGRIILTALSPNFAAMEGAKAGEGEKGGNARARQDGGYAHQRGHHRGHAGKAQSCVLH